MKETYENFIILFFFKKKHLNNCFYIDNKIKPTHYFELHLQFSLFLYLFHSPLHLQMEQLF